MHITNGQCLSIETIGRWFEILNDDKENLLDKY